MNNEREIARLIRESHEWCNDPKNNRIIERTKFVRDSLRRKDPKAAAVMLGFIGDIHANQGAAKILSGDATGWTGVRRGVEYRWWRARLGGENLAQVAGLLLGHLISFDDERSVWLAEDLSRGEPRYRGWRASHFASFALWLARARAASGRAFAAKQETLDLGVYQQVLEAWNDTERLQVALTSACDYHVQQTNDRRHEDAEFAYGIYALFPVEVLAVIAARRRCGLATPSLAHPLMATRLAHPPDAMPQAEVDPLVEDLVRCARANGIFDERDSGTQQ